MRFHISSTTSDTKRVWVETGMIQDTEEEEEKTDILEKNLTSLALWHGPDKKGENFFCWEFNPIYEDDIRELLTEYTEESGFCWCSSPVRGF